MMTLTRNARHTTSAPGSPDPKRRRRFQVSLAGLGVAGVLGVLGTAMMSNANFSDRYVSDQLAKQRITFRELTRSPTRSAGRHAW